MELRYERNIPSVSPEEQATLSRKRVLVTGCGGLGGFLIEYLARMGVGELTVADGDVFEASNLNRQLLSAPETLGKGKAATAAARVRRINPQVKVVPVEAFFGKDNADLLTEGQDLALDALDSAESRLILEDACAKWGVTIVHGAIMGWSAQVTVARPGENTLHRLYGKGFSPRSKTSLPFTPAFCAAVQAAEAVKLLCGRPSALEGKLLVTDLLQMNWEVIQI
ncbi:MAG: HesA/MoeB/ThiF family protein [Clostridia bacterium]|nr:HesA/MoeB/ThiF family protein [Clostridia bacterium]